MNWYIKKVWIKDKIERDWMKQFIIFYYIERNVKFLIDLRNFFAKDSKIFFKTI